MSEPEFGEVATFHFKPAPKGGSLSLTLMVIGKRDLSPYRADDSVWTLILEGHIPFDGRIYGPGDIGPVNVKDLE